VSNREEGERRYILGFLGLGLDNQDGHHRLTRSEEFLLVGGSAETHERMLEMAQRFSEALRRQGRRLEETPAEEAIELLRQSLES
jgi:hypothetical protein